MRTPARSPEIDVVIAAHDPSRPVGRAVASALPDDVEVRVTVVAHGVEADLMRAAIGPAAEDPRVRVMTFDDGVRSPAGPFNAGLAAADGEWLSLMGSDDEFAPGALSRWLSYGTSHVASAVIAPLRRAGDGYVPTPPIRPWRRGTLDPVSDRLAYRTAPLGLLRASSFGKLRMTPRMPSGEDLEFGLAVWFSRETVVYAHGAPAYLVHADGGSRVTGTRRPVAEDLRPVAALRVGEWYGALGERERTAIAIKLIRIHLFGTLATRQSPADWTRADLDALSEEALALRACAPGAERDLSRVDRHLLDAIASGGDVRVMLADAARRRRRLNPGNLVTGDLGRMLAREAPIRFAAASALRLRG